MRRIATALCATAGFVALLAPASAGAAFGPVGSFGGASLNHPQSAAATASTVYVTDTGNNQVDIFDASGTPQGSLAFPPASPRDVAVSPDESTVLAVGSGQVSRWVLGVPLGSFAVPGPSYGIAIDAAGVVYVSNPSTGVINKYDSLGNPGTPATIGSGQLNEPRGLTFAGGSLYVADTGNRRIVKMSPAGAIQQTFAMPGYTVVAGGQTFTGQIEPFDVAVDPSGRVFAPDAGTHSNLVAVLGSDGSLQQLFGRPDSDPTNPCPVRNPWGVAYGANQLYVVSTGENRVRRFNEAGGACPTPNFGSGGGVTPPGGGGGGGGAGGTAGALSDRTAPDVTFSGFPKKNRCAKRNFAITIHARDDVLLRKLTLYVNRRRTDSQLIYKQYWDVTVNIPVRKVRKALPPGMKVRVLIEARVIDQSGKQTKVGKSFKICG